MLLSGCAAKIEGAVAPLCPPAKVLDDWAAYKDGTPEGNFVIRFSTQQEKLSGKGKDFWKDCAN